MNVVVATMVVRYLVMRYRVNTRFYLRYFGALVVDRFLKLCYGGNQELEAEFLGVNAGKTIRIGRDEFNVEFAGLFTINDAPYVNGVG